MSKSITMNTNIKKQPRHLENTKGALLHEELYRSGEKLVIIVGIAGLAFLALMISILYIYTGVIYISIITAIGWVLLEVIIVAGMLMFWYYSKPVRLYENGISMTLLFNKGKLFQTIFISVDEIAKVYGYNPRTAPRPIKPGSYSGLVVKTKQGSEFKTGLRFRNHQKELLEIIGKNFPEVSLEER